MKKYLAMLAAVLTLAACGGGEPDITDAAAPAVQPLPVYLVMGQSNARGAKAYSAQLSAEWKQPQSAVMFDGTAWQPMVPGPVNFGPEVSFAKRMGAVGIIKIAQDGTNLAKDWSAKIPGPLYSATLDAVRTARATRPIKLMGVVWMQGESDGEVEEYALAYGANLTEFIQSLRRDLGEPNLPFVVGRITSPVNAGFPYTPQVRTAQMNFAWVDCDALPKDVDTLHYNTEGELGLGNLFADKYLTNR